MTFLSSTVQTSTFPEVYETLYGRSLTCEKDDFFNLNRAKVILSRSLRNPIRAFTHFWTGWLFYPKPCISHPFQKLTKPHTGVSFTFEKDDFFILNHAKGILSRSLRSPGRAFTHFWKGWHFYSKPCKSHPFQKLTKPYTGVHSVLKRVTFLY